MKNQMPQQAPYVAYLTMQKMSTCHFPVWGDLRQPQKARFADVVRDLLGYAPEKPEKQVKRDR